MTNKQENVILYIIMSISIVALFYMSGSFHSLWMLIMLMAINTK